MGEGFILSRGFRLPSTIAEKWRRQELQPARHNTAVFGSSENWVLVLSSSCLFLATLEPKPREWCYTKWVWSLIVTLFQAGSRLCHVDKASHRNPHSFLKAGTLTWDLWPLLWLNTDYYPLALFSLPPSFPSCNLCFSINLSISSEYSCLDSIICITSPYCLNSYPVHSDLYSLLLDSVLSVYICFLRSPSTWVWIGIYQFYQFSQRTSFAFIDFSLLFYISLISFFSVYLGFYFAHIFSTSLFSLFFLMW